ncbi:MAG: zinc-dependent metalloprotease [Pseudomonadota bacterium]
MPRFFYALLTIAACAVCTTGTAGDREVAKAIQGLETRQGLFDIHVSPDGGTLLSTLPAAGPDGHMGEFIYAARLRSGLGSNPVGLDRGAGNDGKIVSFQRVGKRVIVEAINTDYIAATENANEIAAVRESFATSVLWSGEILATADDGRLLVDMQSFLTRDALDVTSRLARTGQGSFSLDTARSFVAGEQLAFPENVELEAKLTFASREPGSEVFATTPDARAVTLTLHHSFVRLPDDGFAPRTFDQRSGAIDVSFYDFSQPLAGQLPQRLARRYRLQKTNPGAARSPVVKPIVFYIDSGAPEPIRSALLDGARWWADAFEAAGFENGYRAELLPDDVHPLDVRYNVVQWVHRQTRGWSYGGGVSDPRTGEMLKGHVILGSQRVRQDRMIFEGLAGADNTGSASADDPLQIALARIRQLSAHEIGHALGFAHNMAASSNDRASVMDYPAPWVRVSDDNSLDFSAAYAAGMGAWDLFTVAWLYSEFPAGMDQDEQLEALIRDAETAGLRFVADTHSRPISAAHPYGSLWDNGSDPVESLRETLNVRRIALANFDIGALQSEQPQSDLQTVFAPVYLYHRYQTLAAAKFIGGYEFGYALAASKGRRVTPVPAQDQRRALAAVLQTLSSDVLAIDQSIVSLMQPPIQPWEPILGRERIDSTVSPLFDPLTAAGAAARITLRALLNPARLGRVAATHRLDGRALGLRELLDQTTAVVFDTGARGEARASVQAVVQEQYLSMLMHLDSDHSASAAVRAAARATLARVSALLEGRSSLSIAPDMRRWLSSAVTSYLENGELPANAIAAEPEIPPGSPIGAASCWHCDSAQLLR